MSATKGIENDSLMFMDEVLAQELPPHARRALAFLSGPSFAKELAHHLPTAVVVAAHDADVASRVMHRFHTHYLRTYASNDVVGVECGGALKNVIAIAAGAVDGMGFGHNTRAALITRGLAEVAKLAMARGGSALTLAGLAGMGDLVLTCTGELSRNRTVGYEMGRGRSLSEVLASLGHVAEGVKTAKSAYDLSKKLGVTMPITSEVYAVLYEDKPVQQAVKDLMARELGYEFDPQAIARGDLASRLALPMKLAVKRSPSEDRCALGFVVRRCPWVRLAWSALAAAQYPPPQQPYPPAALPAAPAAVSGAPATVSAACAAVPAAAVSAAAVSGPAAAAVSGAAAGSVPALSAAAPARALPAARAGAPASRAPAEPVPEPRRDGLPLRRQLRVRRRDGHLDRLARQGDRPGHRVHRARCSSAPAVPIGMYAWDYNQEFDRGVPSSIATGLLLGGVEGMAISGLQWQLTGNDGPNTWSFRTWTSITFATATAGGLGGYAFGEWLRPDPRSLALISSGAGWGAITGVLFGSGVVGGDWKDGAAVWGFAGYNAGILAAGAGRRRHTCRRGRPSSTCGWAICWAHWQRPRSTSSTSAAIRSPRHGLIANAVGGLAGLGLAAALTASMTDPPGTASWAPPFQLSVSPTQGGGQVMAFGQW